MRNDPADRHATLELPQGRARLEPLSLAHADELFAIFVADPRVWQYFTDAAPTTPDATRTAIQRVLASAADFTCLPFAIVDRNNNSCVGSTRLFDIDTLNRSAEIGYTWLSPDARRSSINTECKYLLLRHAFASLSLTRVQLKCDARNLRSQEAIQRIGGQFEGRLRKHRVCHDGYVRDTILYSILSEEWPAVQGRLRQRLGL